MLRASLQELFLRFSSNLQLGIYFSERVYFFPTYFTTLFDFFPISCKHFYCSLLDFFPNYNFGWIVSPPKSREFARIYIPCEFEVFLLNTVGLHGTPILLCMWHSMKLWWWPISRCCYKETPPSTEQNFDFLPALHLRNQKENSVLQYAWETWCNHEHLVAQGALSMC